jgi:hypothetical protein
VCEGRFQVGSSDSDQGKMTRIANMAIPCPLYRAPTLGSTVHHVSVPGSVADTHRLNKIDIKIHTFINNRETHYKVHITWLGPLTL